MAVRYNKLWKILIDKKMKKKDLIFIAACAVVVALFFVVEPLNTWFMSWSKAHDWRYFVLAFLKFGVLATVGECIGLRISKGVYNQKESCLVLWFGEYWALQSPLQWAFSLRERSIFCLTLVSN